MKNRFLIPFIIVLLLFIGAGAFGIWAFVSRQDYKNNVQAKIDTAVQIATQQNSATKDKEFAEKEKLPLKSYQGPAAFGSLVVMYPKTWSAYVNEQQQGQSSTPIDGYFNPSFVPATTSQASYALRVQVLNSSYTNELKKYDSLVKTGKVKATPYVPAKVQTVTGMRLDGEIATGKTGAMVIVPMRDKTLKLWTESNTYMGDFNNIILPNYSFEQ
jgi:hypothetical protein